MIKGGYFRNNNTTSKNVSGRSKNLDLSKNTKKWIESSLLIPTNFVSRLLLYRQTLSPTAHFFRCCIVVSELPTLNLVWGISKLFFRSYNIKFGGLERLFCNFLWSGLVVAFLAFMALKMEKEGITSIFTAN